MADIDIDRVMTAGRGLIDRPPPGCMIDMYPGTVSTWLADDGRDRITVQLIKPGKFVNVAGVPVVVLTDELDNAMRALTGMADAGRDGIYTTARELRLASYVGRLADAARNLMANRPGGFFSGGRMWEQSRAKLADVLAELGGLSPMEVMAADVFAAERAERDAGRQAAAERGEQSTIPPIILPEREPQTVGRVTVNEGRHTFDARPDAAAQAGDVLADLRSRFDPRVTFPDEVSRRAAAEIERLRRELDTACAGAAATGRELAQARAELVAQRDEMRAVLAHVPNGLRIEVRPGGAKEDLSGTLAVTVANVVMMYDAAVDHAADVGRKLDAAGKATDERHAAEVKRLAGELDAVRLAANALRDKFNERSGELDRARADLSNTARFLKRREDEVAEYAGRCAAYRKTAADVFTILNRPLRAVNDAADHVAEARRVLAEVLARWPAPSLNLTATPDATDTKAGELPGGFVMPASVAEATEHPSDDERADRMREEAVFFGARNAYYRSAMLTARNLLVPRAGGVVDAGDVARACMGLADALKPTSGPKRAKPGAGDRGPDLLGELLAYREAVADSLVTLDAAARQSPGLSVPVRVVADTLRLVTDHAATPRQMARASEGESPVVRALEDAQAQLAALRAAVGVAGFGIVLLPGACVRLQDMRAEDKGDDGGDDSDHSGTPMSSDVDREDALNDADERDDREAELRADVLKLSDRVAGLRVLLNFSELRCRAMGRLLHHERARETDAAAALLAAVDAMSRAVVATLTAHARGAGVLTAGQFSRAAYHAANEVRLLIGERDHVSPEAYSLPAGFTGP